MAILWPTMEPLHILSSPSHTFQNWCMVSPEEGKLGRENIIFFSLPSQISPIPTPFPALPPSSYSSAFLWQSVKADTVQEAHRMVLTSQMSSWRRRLFKGTSGLSWPVASIMHDVHQGTNPSNPMRSDCVRNLEVSERGIAFPRTSWIYSFMVYCNMLMLSMDAIILEGWNSKSQHWTYCPALGFMCLSELVILSQSMGKNRYAKGQIYLILS